MARSTNTCCPSANNTPTARHPPLPPGAIPSQPSNVIGSRRSSSRRRASSVGSNGRRSGNDDEGNEGDDEGDGGSGKPRGKGVLGKRKRGDEDAELLAARVSLPCGSPAPFVEGGGEADGSWRFRRATFPDPCDEDFVPVLEPIVCLRSQISGPHDRPGKKLGSDTDWRANEAARQELSSIPGMHWDGESERENGSHLGGDGRRVPHLELRPGVHFSTPQTGDDSKDSDGSDDPPPGTPSTGADDHEAGEPAASRCRRMSSFRTPKRNDSDNDDDSPPAASTVSATSSNTSYEPLGQPAKTRKRPHSQTPDDSPAFPPWFPSYHWGSCNCHNLDDLDERDFGATQVSPNSDSTATPPDSADWDTRHWADYNILPTKGKKAFAPFSAEQDYVCMRANEQPHLNDIEDWRKAQQNRHSNSRRNSRAPSPKRHRQTPTPGNGAGRGVSPAPQPRRKTDTETQVPPRPAMPAAESPVTPNAATPTETGGEGFTPLAERTRRMTLLVSPTLPPSPSQSPVLEGRTRSEQRRVEAAGSRGREHGREL